MEETFWIQHEFIKSMKKNTTTYINKRIKKDGITSAQSFFILLILENDNKTQSELTKLMSCDKSFTNRTICALIEKDIVSKVSSSSSKNIMLTLTKKGQLLGKRLFEYLKEWSSLITKGLTHEELAVLKTVTLKIDMNASYFATASTEEITAACFNNLIVSEEE